jgi:hypothetical protein
MYGKWWGMLLRFAPRRFTQQNIDGIDKLLAGR